jgi:signal transduction histidine kinase
VRAAEETLELPKRVQHFLTDDAERDEFDVNAVIQATLARVRMPQSVTVNTTLTDGIPTIRTYSLDVVVENIVRNAIDAMPDGGSIDLHSKLVSVPGVSGGLVELTIADTGLGMSDDVLKRLFHIDFTTKRRKDGKGLGVGLWWVRQWVRRSNGDIDVKSTLGAGTTFTIKLPLPVDEAVSLSGRASQTTGG